MCIMNDSYYMSKNSQTLFMKYSKELKFCHNRKFYSFATWWCKLLIFKIYTIYKQTRLIVSNIKGLIQRVAIIAIRRSEFAAKTQVLCALLFYFIVLLSILTKCSFKVFTVTNIKQVCNVITKLSSDYFLVDCYWKRFSEGFLQKFVQW